MPTLTVPRNRKPERLKANYAGFWSRRISGEHRLVYRVSGGGAEQMLEIAQCRFHYAKTKKRKTLTRWADPEVASSADLTGQCQCE